MKLNRYIDHTILKPVTTLEDIKKLCMEAVEYDFAAVCVPPPEPWSICACCEPCITVPSGIVWVAAIAPWSIPPMAP